MGKLRAGLESFNCPREFIEDRAGKMAAHKASASPHLELQVVSEEVVDSSDSDERRTISVPRVRVVDINGKVAIGHSGEPLTIRRYIADFVYHNPRDRWTIAPLCE